ncbi:hypothetical protein AgCh_030247 [Apium graveolens]
MILLPICLESTDSKKQSTVSKSSEADYCAMVSTVSKMSRLDRLLELFCCSLNMSAVKITGAIAASFVVAFTCTTPGTVSNKEWAEETDKKFQAWPRTAGPPVVMNPISRQNFIVKGSSEE